MLAYLQHASLLEDKKLRVHKLKSDFPFMGQTDTFIENNWVSSRCYRLAIQLMLM